MINEEPNLWDKLLKDGYTYKVIYKSPTLFERFLSLFGKKIIHKRIPNENWLTKEINGKTVDIFADIWYITANVDGKTIFDARRFDDEELFDIIREHTSCDESLKLTA